MPSGGEIALRMALGAEPTEILRWVGRHAALLVGTGLAVGVPAAWSVSRALRGLLYGVSPYDPLAVVAAAAGVVGLAAAAAGLPLRRATRVDAARELVRR
ncbi:MAG: FtsX-like permease family protein [Gemmatimonadota bacterium]